MMQIGKLDEFNIKLVKLRQHNLLSQVSITVDLVFSREDVPMQSKFLVIKEKDILTELRKLFADKYINNGEIFLLSLMNGGVIIKVIVDSVEAITKDGSIVTFGKIEE